MNTKKGKKFTEEEIQKQIKKIDSTMALEGMPLTDEIKERLYNCMIGKTTFEKERKKILEKYRRIYG